MNKTERRATVGAGIITIVGSALIATDFIQSPKVRDAWKEPVAQEILEHDYERRYVKDPQDALPQDLYFFFQQYKDDLIRLGDQYNVAPELVMGFVVEENKTRPLCQDIFDRVVSLPGIYNIRDPSLGIGQINLSTARLLESYFGRESHSDRETITALEQDALVNLEYITMNVRHLQDTLPPPETTSPFEDPTYLNKLGTGYVYGHNSPHIATGSPEGAMYVLAVSNIPSITILGEEVATITRADQHALRSHSEGAKYSNK